jgi:hypothetical protein
MNIIAKQFTIFCVIAALLFIPSAASAQGMPDKENPDSGKMAFDILLMRPFGMIATVLGSAAFVVSLPFSFMGGNIEPAYEKMVEDPAAYTFNRSLGDF